MIRRLLILGAAALVPALAHAQDNGSAHVFDRFWKICSAAVDDKPELESIATSSGFKGPNGAMMAMTVGRQSIRPMMADDNKQTINVIVTKYDDAREIECMSINPTPTPRADLELAIAPLSLDGAFTPVPGQTIGRWKRHGLPFVLITATSTSSSTVLSMRRIDTQ